MEVILDPRNKMLYSSFYLKGLMDIYGKRSVKFSLKPFVDLHRIDTGSFDQYMAYVMKEKTGVFRKIIIDYCDYTAISQDAYAWCDVYAKINISIETNLSEYIKLVNIPPGFGIRIWSIPYMIYRCFADLILCKFKPLTSLYEYFYYWYGFRLRYDLGCYANSESCMEKYIFHASTLWSRKNDPTDTNTIRAKFIRVCKSIPNLQFEGGLVSKSSPLDDFCDVVYQKRFSIHDYLVKTKKSVLVFNTPAVLNCHGWKLGEYLAMGKAIISTPLSNRLPFPMIDNEDCLIVKSEDEISKAICRLMTDKELRYKLEKASKDKFEKYCSPVAVIKRINLAAKLYQ